MLAGPLAGPIGMNFKVGAISVDPSVDLAAGFTLLDFGGSILLG